MIKQELQSLFVKLLSPAILFIVVLEILKYFGYYHIPEISRSRILDISLILLAACSALAFPLMYRTWFINGVRGQQSVQRNSFMLFQKRSLLIVLSSAYVFSLVSFLGASDVVYYSVFLLALYGTYYYFPSQKRITFEMRLFKVSEN